MAHCRWLRRTGRGFAIYRGRCDMAGDLGGRGRRRPAAAFGDEEKSRGGKLLEGESLATHPVRRLMPTQGEHGRARMAACDDFAIFSWERRGAVSYIALYKPALTARVRAATTWGGAEWYMNVAHLRIARKREGQTRPRRASSVSKTGWTTIRRIGAELGGVYREFAEQSGQPGDLDGQVWRTAKDLEAPRQVSSKTRPRAIGG